MMSPSRIALFLLLAALGTVAAQAPAPSADGASPEALLAGLNAVISGPAGHRDWARFRALWLPGARIQFARSGRGGNGTIASESPEDYIKQDDPYFAAHDFFETTLVARTERYANIAQIWTSFALRRSPAGPPTQRGAESIQCLFDGQRWWIANLLDQPESPAQPLPADLSSR
ncbi:MAG TPA: hypothetical protein VN690_02490 [Terriglobales bacterium]|nr:hypothetical protein [Terriglobales bacterium]